jgi:monothiol glutaredoxin
MFAEKGAKFPPKRSCYWSSFMMIVNRLILASRGGVRLTRCSEVAALASSSLAGGGFVASHAAFPSRQWQNTTHRSLSTDSSHDDFAPKKKVDLSKSDNDGIHDMIDSHVKSNRIMLYMKGSPSQPMCGFSATVVSILKKSGADFSSVNVLDYPEVRDGVKKYSQWPTIPQLYINGEFIGGCDIVKDMDESGELQKLLQVEDGGEKK